MKNIFKKLLAMGIALMMVSACVYLPAFAASGDNEDNNENIVVGDILDEIGNENSDNNEVTEKKITIAFKIGDSILKINDQDVAVTTPYEQNGTTLVPLRVITEAFGATVEWNDADMGVTLTYEDVVNKFRYLANRVYSDPLRTESIVEFVNDLENQKDMSELMKLVNDVK